MFGFPQSDLLLRIEQFKQKEIKDEAEQHRLVEEVQSQSAQPNRFLQNLGQSLVILGENLQSRAQNTPRKASRQAEFN